jgi:response regulator RpfG family c-di-GMP phosphodiesterase
MTGYSDTIEITEAYELGVKEFIPKPFRRETIISIVKRILNSESDEPLEIKLNETDVLTSQNYYSISIDTFYSEKLDYPIYLKLSSKKMIKLVESGTELTTDRIAAYQGKGVIELFIKKDDFINYINKLNSDISNGLIKSDEITKEEKLEIMTKINSHLFEYGFRDIFSEELFKNISNNLNSIIEISLNNHEILSLVDNLIEKFPLNFAHSYGVAFLAIAIGKESKIKSTQNIFTLAIAGIFHDIGLKALPDKIINKERLYYNDEEEKIFRSHPTLGQKIVNELSSCPKIIGQIILEHHEYVDGSGFPNSLKGDNILPLTKIITLASDALDQYKLNCKDKENRSFKNILKEFNQNLDKYDPVFMNGFKNICNNIINK